MKKIHKIFIKFYHEKGRSFLLLPFFMLTACLMGDLSRYGRVTLHNTANRESFIFTVTDQFIEDNQDSPTDKEHPRLTKAEAKLLSALLAQKKYCFDKNNDLAFTITSRQERVFDMTFAHLIEQNYRARPIVPHTYFGECGVKKN